MKELMDNFEDAIKDYVTKNIDPITRIVSYTFTKRIKRNIILVTDVAETMKRYTSHKELIDKRNARRDIRNSISTTIKDNLSTLPMEAPKPLYRGGYRARGCTTPDGSFGSVKEAAEFYGLNPTAMCNKIKSKVTAGVEQWSFINYDRLDT